MEQDQHSETVSSSPVVDEKRQIRSKKKYIIIAIVVLAVAALVFRHYSTKENVSSTAGDVQLPEGMVLPPAVDPSSIGKVVKEPSSGKEYISNQVIVGFKDGVSVEDMTGALDTVQGKQIQRFTNVPLFLIQVPDDGTGEGAQAAIKKLKSMQITEDATLNYLTEGQM